MGDKTIMEAIKAAREDDDIKAIYEVLKSNFITQGPKVQEFEEKLSEIVDVKYSVAVSNATSALHLACLALGLKEGDLVWTFKEIRIIQTFL